ncbi:hypothetical protein [Sphingobacterium spiritivorum]|uniref:hypothetical protein n=1 Tax=Sphingobacterium spiritivorum TaxID=258 RepID=UPI003DA524BD
MANIKKLIGIGTTLFIVICLGSLYYSLEVFYYSDFGCGCSSNCRAYYPVFTSRFIGYIFIICSAALFIAGIWRLRGLSRVWIIPAMLIFGVASYGNGYMIFNKGSCGLSLNRTIFFINQTKLGDFAKANAESINIDSLNEGKLKGKLLGYALNGRELTAFRIDAEPLKISTGFLFWYVPDSIIINDISYGLSTLRNIEAENVKGHYEFIGGQGMVEKDFLNEFMLTQRELSGILKNKRIINSKDGTTRFLFEMDE